MLFKQHDNLNVKKIFDALFFILQPYSRFDSIKKNHNFQYLFIKQYSLVEKTVTSLE